MSAVRIRPVHAYDVLVAGAGPAGASAAAHLAAAGAKVAMLDRQGFPRDKVCGDFVGPVALVELKRLGVSDRDEYRATNVIRRASLFLDGEELISRRIPAVPGLPSYGRVVPRKQLDRWILDAAIASGAELRERHTVRGVEVEPDGITVVASHGRRTHRLRARCLIGADGSSSTVATTLRGRASEPDDRIVAVRAYYEDVHCDPECADLFFTADSFPGYYWLFPTGRGRANVGVGMVLETVPAGRVHLQGLLERLIDGDAALRERMHGARRIGRIVGWPLSTYNPRARVVDDRLLLAGDAAGLINPLNGEGIQYAILSGRWASEVLLPALEDDDLGARRLARYQRRVDAELRYDMALAGIIVQAIRNRSLTSVWLEALRVIVGRARVDPDYAEIAGGILAGLLPASDALRPGFVIKTLEQAVISTGVRSATEVLLRPGEIPGHGVRLASAAAAVAGQVLRDPVRFTGWGLGLAAGGAELAFQAARNSLRARGRSAD